MDASALITMKNVVNYEIQCELQIYWITCSLNAHLRLLGSKPSKIGIHDWLSVFYLLNYDFI
jgi:hypothetical protein